MKLIVAGMRDFTDFNFVYKQLDEFRAHTEVSEIVSGGASGVDTAGQWYAHYNGVELRRFPADWKKHGRGAGPIRNREMAQYADALLAIWNGRSVGTADMIDAMRKLDKPVYIVRVET